MLSESPYSQAPIILTVELGDMLIVFFAELCV